MVSLRSFTLRAVTFLFFSLLLGSTAYYIHISQPRKHNPSLIKIPESNCVLELSVEIHTDEAGWFSDAKTFVSTEWVSIFNQDGEALWGSRNMASVKDEATLFTNETGLEHDIQFSSTFDIENPELLCNGGYGGTNFTGDARKGTKSNGYNGDGIIYSCIADFHCKKHANGGCHRHPESRHCPDTDRDRANYRHGECVLYLTEYLTPTEDEKVSYDITIDDPTGMNIAVDTLAIAQSGNTTMQKRLEYPLYIHTGKNVDKPINFEYKGTPFTKNGKSTNSACKVSKGDDEKMTRDSTCRFQC